MAPSKASSGVPRCTADREPYFPCALLASSGTSIFLWAIRQMLLGRRARRERRGASRPDRRAGRRDRRARRTPARVMNRAGLGANWFPRLRPLLPRAGFSLLGVPPPRQIATASELSVFARLRPALPCCFQFC